MAGVQKKGNGKGNGRGQTPRKKKAYANKNKGTNHTAVSDSLSRIMTGQTNPTQFQPDNCNTKAILLIPKKCPLVIISKLAMDKIWHYVKFAGTKEVSWYGTVEHDPAENTFTITDTFLFDQEVTGTETEIDHDSQQKFIEELMMDDPEKALEVVEKLRFWGHCHPFHHKPGEKPAPSPQDNTNLMEYNNYDWYIRGICNRNGHFLFDVAYFNENIVFKDVPWQPEAVENSEMHDTILRDFELKVKQKTYVQNFNNGHGGYGYHGGAAGSNMGFRGGNPGGNTSVIPSRPINNSFQTVPINDPNPEPDPINHVPAAVTPVSNIGGSIVFEEEDEVEDWRNN